MKYSLSSRQSKKYLTLADEIIVESRDYRQISDLFIEYPDKMIILQIENEKLNEIDYNDNNTDLDERLIKTLNENENLFELKINFDLKVEKQNYIKNTIITKTLA